MTTFVIPKNCPMSEDTLVLDPRFPGPNPGIWKLRELLDFFLMMDMDQRANPETVADSRPIPKSIVRITSVNGTVSWNFIFPAIA